MLVSKCLPKSEDHKIIKIDSKIKSSAYIKSLKLSPFIQQPTLRFDSFINIMFFIEFRKKKALDCEKYK